MPRVFVVTGGTSGIGLAVLRNLSENKDNVVVSFSRHKQKIVSAAKLLEGVSSNVTFLEGDICNVNDCQHLYDFLAKKYGFVHGLVNAAGTLNRGRLETLQIEEWKRVMDVNVNGPFIITKSLLPLLKTAGDACIVNVSSIAGMRPGTSLAYSVSKAALDMFTTYIAGELAGFNIRVNSVNPGFVKTNLHYANNIVKSDTEYAKMIDKVIKKYPLKRAGEAVEIAALICFLLGKNAAWITGSLFKIDGGALVYNELNK